MPSLSEYSCPTCKKQGQMNQIAAGGGQLICLGFPNDHKWNDTMAFWNEKPTMDYKVPLPVFPPIEGMFPMTVSLPGGIKDALEKKYGSRLNATIGDLLALLVVEGQTIIVPPVDTKRMKEKLGELGIADPLRNSADLYGMIFTLGEKYREEKENARQAMEDVQAYNGMNRGTTLVSLGPHHQNAVEKAKAEGIPLRVYLERNLATALENNWF